MKTIRVFDIEWETDGEEVHWLPTELGLTLPEDEATTSHVLEWLSDTFGWLILNLKIEECINDNV